MPPTQYPMQGLSAKPLLTRSLAVEHLAAQLSYTIRNAFTRTINRYESRYHIGLYMLWKPLSTTRRIDMT